MLGVRINGVTCVNYDAFVDGIRFDPDIKSFVLLLEEARDTDSKDSETFAFIMQGKEPGDSEVTFSDGCQTTRL